MKNVEAQGLRSTNCDAKIKNVDNQIIISLKLRRLRKPVRNDFHSNDGFYYSDYSGSQITLAWYTRVFAFPRISGS